jgi:hypothetical protein
MMTNDDVEFLIDSTDSFDFLVMTNDDVEFLTDSTRLIRLDSPHAHHNLMLLWTPAESSATLLARVSRRRTHRATATATAVLVHVVRQIGDHASMTHRHAAAAAALAFGASP